MRKAAVMQRDKAATRGARRTADIKDLCEEYGEEVPTPDPLRDSKPATITVAQFRASRYLVAVLKGLR